MHKAFKGLLTLLIVLLTLADGSAQVPENLTSSRSAMVISVPDIKSGGFITRGDWKSVADKAHKSFRKIGLDAIIYIYKDDLKAGAEITKSYKEVLQKRQIANIVLLSVSGENYNFNYELDIYPIQRGINLSHPSYSISAKTLNDLMLILGRQVLRQEIARTNFLIPDQPEFLDDLVLYTGVRYQNIPGRIRSLGLAVVKFDSINIPEDISETEKNDFIKKNREIALANSELDQILKQNYPFKYDLVDFESVESLYKKGYQYALMPIISSGPTIKQMLNYKTLPTETIYISEISKKGEKTTLKKISANANMTKFYIKQTIVKDVHVGKRWDADITWQQSLENFITNLKYDFNIK